MRSGIPSNPGLMNFGAMPPITLMAFTSFCSMLFSLMLFTSMGQVVRIFFMRANTLGQACFFFYIDVFLYYIEILVRLSEKLLFWTVFRE